MRFDTIEGAARASLRQQLLLALGVCVFLLVGLGGIAAFAEISGAVIGSGKIIAQGRAKAVQHPDGGIIGEILVKEGDRVTAGQTLFRLDGTRARASLGVIDSQLAQLLAQDARLLAEQARLTQIDFPAQLFEIGAERAQLHIDGQRALLVARRETRDGRKAQIDKQISQYGEQIAALEAQQKAIDDSLVLLDDQIADFTTLNTKGLLINSQMTAVRRERVSLIGNRSALTSKVIETQQAKVQAELQKFEVDAEFDQGVLTELNQHRSEIARLSEERIAAVDRLTRLDIRAPRDGYLHELNVHTVGGVIAAGDTLVQVVSIDDDLIIEARMAANDVDQVHREKPARIRLTGLNQRVTPELNAHILDVSPDLTTDHQTGASYYVTRLKIDDGELAKVGENELRPGMPVEVFVETSARSILSYIVKPISDQIQHALREG